MNRILNLFGPLWALLVIVGLVLGFANEAQPGAAALPAANLPGKPGPTAPNRYQLLVFAHPNCPCTRATLAELAKLLTRLNGMIDTAVYFYKPETTLEEVQNSENWRLAAAIPGVAPLYDPNGAITARFDAKVSGQTLLYSPDGTLLFNGGITVSRGHQGDSPGAAYVIEFVAGQRAGFVNVPVFGCALADPNPSILREQPSWSKP